MSQMRHDRGFTCVNDAFAVARSDLEGACMMNTFRRALRA